jgi:hypothetical protein
VLCCERGIITSASFQLVDDRTARTGIAIHLVSVDASPAKLPKGVISAVSVMYTFFGGPIEYYSGAQVFLVGSKKVRDIASGPTIRDRNPCLGVKRSNRKMK